jgi:GNAT superfamily N-acetyltransferase
MSAVNLEDTKSWRPQHERPGERAMETNAPSRAYAQDTRIEIIPVSNGRDRNAFVDLTDSIYRQDPHWVAPLKSEVKAFIDPKRHPFYEHGEAMQFIARRDGKVVGRIMASDDPRYNAQHGTNLGCFGMFESINDQEIANRLLNAAVDWLKTRGRDEMLGPIDYSTNYPCGLLIDGFDTPPRIMMNHQPPYYARLLENWGLAKAKDLYAWWFEGENNQMDGWRERTDRLAERFGVTVRPARLDDFEAEVRRCKQVYNEAWDDSWGFVKMTDAEFKHLAHSIKQLNVPELILLAEVKGKPVGLSITLPDINEALTGLNGRLTSYGLPIGLFKLLCNMRRIKTARMAVLGVVDGYRRRGIAEMLIFKTLDYGKNTLNYTGAELGWTLEDNDLINRSIERVGGQRYKSYRLYNKRIG